MGRCEGVNFLFAFELNSFVSRPENGQIMFNNRARLPLTKTFFNAFFERVQTLFSSYLSRTPIKKPRFFTRVIPKAFGVNTFFNRTNKVGFLVHARRPRDCVFSPY